MSRHGYGDEGLSPVFRFQDFKITRMPDDRYFWHRGEPGAEGGVFCRSPRIPGLNQPQVTCLQTYATCTVFRGWKFRPIILMENDATLHDVDYADEQTSGCRRRQASNDGTLMTCMAVYHALGFDKRPGSLISVAGPRSKPYAAGRDAGWVGTLVPDLYTNPNGRNASPSEGLAGSLPLILGLMYVCPPSVPATRSASSTSSLQDLVYPGTTYPLCRKKPQRIAKKKFFQGTLTA